jgi:beta-lactamase regulating signal transducer with metallopeptidase domain
MTMESFFGLKYLDLISEFMIKSSLILCCALLFFFLFRKKSASMRHFLLSFSLISLLLLPLLSTFMTGWETRFLPSWQTAENITPDFNEAFKNKGSLGHLNQGDIPIQENSTFPSGLEKNKSQDKKTFLQSMDVTTILGLSLITIWTAGLIFLLIRIIAGLYGAHRLTRQGKRISGPFWQLLLERFLSAIFIRRKISLLSHDKVRVPLTWGVFKHVVIIPAEAENWNRDECSSALFHELSHVKRSDFLFKILAYLSCALYWFNPLSWFVFRLMRKEQEKACDELVLKAGVKPSTYAANLLSIQKAGQFQWNPPATVLGAVGKSQLNERLLAVLKQQLKPKEVKMKTKILLSLSVIAAITFIGLARPAQSTASSTAIFSDNNELMTEIQNTTQAESSQEKQEKKKTEKEKKKESTEKKAHVSVSIVKDDKEKKIIVTGQPIVVIKKDHPEKEIVLCVSGKDIELIKGEEAHWTLKADKVHLINEDEDKVIKLDEDTEFCIIIDKGKGDKKIQIIKAPGIHINKALNLPLSCKVQVKGGKKTLHIAPLVDIFAFPPLGIVSLPHLQTEHKKLREKLEELRDKLKKFKESQVEREKEEAVEEALKAVEEVLEEMKEELEKLPKELDAIHIDIKPDLKFKLAKKIKNLKFKNNFIYIQPEIGKKITCFAEKDGGFQIIIKNELDSENKAKYEEVLKKMKESLQECCEVESEIDEENNTITIKITTKKKDEKSKKEVKELVKKVVAELNKIEKK